MSVPEPLTEAVAAAIRSGYRWELDRAIRTNTYLRVLFSVLLAGYAGFGPGVLIRFPASAGGVGYDAVSRFYAFRPVLFALMFVALVCVLAALARRAVVLFEAALAEDTTEATTIAERDRYIRHLRPSPFPFVLSGSILVDLLIYVVILLAYGVWTVILVETVPFGMGAYQIVGVVVGSYGLFAAMIITGLVWSGLAARMKRLIRLPQTEKLKPVRPTGL
ncbi:MAG: hypothetical protein ABIK44_07340 [candidate division WOR-3 bacterium]